MPTYITNTSKQLLIVPLNSGETLHLAPGETSADQVADYELDNNEKVKKLVSNNLLAFETEETEPQFYAAASPESEPEPARPTSRRKPV
jgi:hypothetical protein